ncbi:optic atrophy 3 protein-domain-containing protein [Infundibulicybe gibba]|nr:optic atrophy 3 protein-domain-containing protein [Infundibulicybe gibba]
MASVKIATLLIRTIAKPISAQLKNQAKQLANPSLHERFRTFCVDLAQMMYRSEVKLRTNILGEPAKHIRPLSETRAIENGANALAEGFLFTVAVSLILGETWRSSRNQSKRRDDVDDQLEDLDTRVAELTSRVDGLTGIGNPSCGRKKRGAHVNDELARILERIVEIGLRGGWAEFQDTPLQLPRIQLAPNSASQPPPTETIIPPESSPSPDNRIDSKPDSSNKESESV